MGSFLCCIWWFIAGILLGWLLNWLLSRFFGKDNNCTKNHGHSSSIASGYGIVDNDTNDKVDTKASLVANTPAIDLVLAKSFGFNLKGANDLTVIEGIGPKISELFNTNGVGTFAYLADLSIEQMKQVLKSGGDKFTLARPDTWAEQAALARDNKWNDLKVLQDILVGGIRPEDV
jgi:predicted flap endonuclease-1-like 5' DNA nuclease